MVSSHFCLPVKHFVQSAVFQVSLFQNIKPLFANKPLIVVINKTDILKVEDLPEDKRVRTKCLTEQCIDCCDSVCN